MSLSEIFNGDKLAIVKNPRLIMQSMPLHTPKSLKSEDSVSPKPGKRRAREPIEFLSEIFGWSQVFQTKRFASDHRPFSQGYPSESKKDATIFNQVD